MKTIRLSRGRSTRHVRRLCSRAPRTTRWSCWGWAAAAAGGHSGHVDSSLGARTDSLLPRAPRTLVRYPAYGARHGSPDRGLRRARRHRHRRPRRAATARSTGSACPASTPPPASPPCSGTPEHGRWLHRAGRRRRATHPPLRRRLVRPRDHPRDRRPARCRVTDLMPLGDGRADLVRRVAGVEGTVRMRHEWVVRFGYGKIRPWVRRATDTARHRGHHRHRRPGHARAARPPAPARRRRPARATSSTSRAGEELHLLHDVVPLAPADPAAAGRRRAASTRRSRCRERLGRAGATTPGPTATQVLRSLLMLRLLTHARHRRHRRRADDLACPRTSAASATGTTASAGCATPRSRSRRCSASGYVEETRLWRDWLLRAVAGDPEDLQIMYAVDGARDLPEREPGPPARVRRLAAGAHRQRRRRPAADRRARRGDDRARAWPAQAGLEETDDSWALQRALVDELAGHWDEPDNGLWEIRGPLRHFTHSRVMVWAAFDRAIARGRAARPRRARSSGGASCATRCATRSSTRGSTRERNTFTQHYDTDEVDASLLLIPIVGFLPRRRPAGARHHRGRRGGPACATGCCCATAPQTGVDGLAGDEHPFLACSFWLVERLRRARAAATRRAS